MFAGLENPLHLLLVAVVALVVLGPKRLPEVGRSLGSGLRNFKDAIAGEDAPLEAQAAQPQREPAERA